MASVSAATTLDALQVFESERTQRRTKLYPSYAAALTAKTARESDDEESNASSLGCDDVHTKTAPLAISAMPAPRALSRPELLQVLVEAMRFLPLQDINAARLAAPVLAEAADYVAPQPLGHPDMTFVRWEPTAMPVKLTPFRGVNNFPWRCLACQSLTHGPRACLSCHTPINFSACRVFLGQLRKDLTAELTAYMLRSVAPEIEVLHVESHTNPQDGRGRGCAWVYVSTVEEALKVVALHKHIFADIDADGHEGFWFVRNPAMVPFLGRMADVVGATRHRPQVLPRQPMVAELPGKSIMSDIVFGSQRAAPCEDCRGQPLP